MSIFIDGSQYELISREIRQLHISESNPQPSIVQENLNAELLKSKLETQQKYTRFKQQLKKAFSKSNSYITEKKNLYSYFLGNGNQGFQYLSDIDVFSQETLQIFSSNTKLNTNFSIYSKISIMRATYQIKIVSTLLKNGFPVQPKSKVFKLLLSRYLQKLNLSLADGSFRLNMFTGTIYFRICSLMTSNQFDSLMFDTRSGIEYIRSQLSTSVAYIKFNFYKILHLIEQLPQYFSKYLEYERQNIRKIVQEDKLLPRIKKFIELSSYQFDFQYNINFRKSTETEVGNALQKSRLRYENQLIYSMYDSKEKKQRDTQSSSKKLIYKFMTNQLKQFQKDFNRNLTFSTVKNANTNQKSNIISEIHIWNLDRIKWQTFAEGGFTKIQRGQVKFCFCPSNKDKSQSKQKIELLSQLPQITKYLMKKTAKMQSNKIAHEKAILSKINQYFCLNITKFYESFQPVIQESLLMDLYSHRSLEHLRRAHQQTLSLYSRLYLLSQALQGLRFLRNYKITHLDMKPQNLLVGKGYLLRVTDFGESYHPDLGLTQYRPGYTFPYASPQIFDSQIQFNEKLDVFGVGVMMHELFFENYPLDSRKANMDKIGEKYKTKNYLRPSLALPEKTEAFGPKELMGSLYSLCLKCLHKDSGQRPFLDWIQIIVNDSLSYLQSVY